MIIRKINDDSLLIYSPMVELFNMVISILCDNKNKAYEKVYDYTFVDNIRRKYRFLGDLLKEMNSCGSEIIEFLSIRKVEADEKSLVILCDEGQSLDSFENYILSMTPWDFFYNFYGRAVDKDLIKGALEDSEKMRLLYEKNGFFRGSFLGLKTLFDNRVTYIKDFFRCARELDRKEFRETVKKFEIKLDEEEDKLRAEIQNTSALDTSQNIMGKMFRNRGPYKTYIFMPSIFLVYKAIRFFNSDQILFYEVDSREFKRKDAVKFMKVMSDESRLNIIEILSQKGPINGKDLAAALGIATSTLSHHIEQLRNVGFINEERVKNSKFYSVNFNSMNSFIEYLQRLSENKK